jgi:hypothetical protein
MVRPTSASLNSLAVVLRQALPLYSECRSILNHLDGVDAGASLGSSLGPQDFIDEVSVNKEADSIHQTVLEPIVANHRRIM